MRMLRHLRHPLAPPDSRSRSARVPSRLLLTLFGAALALTHADVAAAQAVRGPRNDAGVLLGHSNVLGGNDDGSSGTVDIGFTLNLFGTSYSQLFVNNNGNVTFDRGLSTYTPFSLTSTATPIVAPFFADVDTRGTADVSQGMARGVVSWNFYDTGTDFATAVGAPVFSATWNQVGYYSSGADKLNTFQLNLIDRSATGAGNFDIEFNYDQIQWETGSASGGYAGLGGSSARAGYSKGTGEAGTSYEMPGSAVNGALLDGGPNALTSGSFGSSTPGRYVFEVRNEGSVVIPGETQQVPLLPSQTIPGDPETGTPPIYVFNNAVSGTWFDPPDTYGYDFVNTSGTLFTALGLPTGFADPFDIFYGSSLTFLGSFVGGSTVDFLAMLGFGVDQFRIANIQPLVDSTDPNAFPAQIFFDQAAGNSFTMTPLLAPTTTTPEPGSMLLLATGLAGLGRVIRRRRNRPEADPAA